MSSCAEVIGLRSYFYVIWLITEKWSLCRGCLNSANINSMILRLAGEQWICHRCRVARRECQPSEVRERHSLTYSAQKVTHVMNFIILFKLYSNVTICCCCFNSARVNLLNVNDVAFCGGLYRKRPHLCVLNLFKVWSSARLRKALQNYKYEIVTPTLRHTNSF